MELNVENFRTVKNTLDIMVSRKFNLNSTIYPIHLDHCVTGRCNATCIMCNIWKQKLRGPELSLEEIDALSKSNYLRKVSVLGISGGEPFLRKDLFDICDVYIQRLKRLRHIIFNTNGILTDKIKEDISRLFDLTDARIEVTVSLDGLHRTHNQIRGIDIFHKCVKTLSTLKEVQQNYDRLDIGIRFLILPQNYQDLYKVYRLSKENDLKFVCKIAYSSEFFKNLGQNFLFNMKQKQQIIDTIRKISELELKDLKLSNLPMLSGFKTVADIFFLKNLEKFIRNPSERAYPCFACFSSAYLDYDGSLYSCFVLYDKIGNIQDMAFDELWVSEKANNTRKLIKKCKLPCYSQCVTAPGLIIYEAPKILWKLITCS